MSTCTCDLCMIDVAKRAELRFHRQKTRAFRYSHRRTKALHASQTVKQATWLIQVGNMTETAHHAIPIGTLSEHADPQHHHIYINQHRERPNLTANVCTFLPCPIVGGIYGQMMELSVQPWSILGLRRCRPIAPGNRRRSRRP
jgi:hypothetical protein